jgi:hypothetical protein
VRLVAGRHGLQLIRHRHFAANHRKLYCLRPLWDAGYVVSKQPDGGFGYVYAPTSREKSATWLSLPDIEQLLAIWSEPAPRARSHRRDPSACTPIYHRMAEARANATQSTSWRDGVQLGTRDASKQAPGDTGWEQSEKWRLTDADTPEIRANRSRERRSRVLDCGFEQWRTPAA